MVVSGALATTEIDTVSNAHVKEGTKSLGKAVCVIVVVAGVVGVVLELTTIILRFVNVGFINMKIKYFLLAVS